MYKRCILHQQFYINNIIGLENVWKYISNKKPNDVFFPLFAHCKYDLNKRNHRSYSLLEMEEEDFIPPWPPHHSR